MPVRCRCVPPPPAPLRPPAQRLRQLLINCPDTAEYLKNITLKWMLSLDRNEQATLLPVIAQILHFSPEEVAAIQAHLQRGPLRRVAGGVSSLLFGGAS